MKTDAGVGPFENNNNKIHYSSQLLLVGRL